MSHLTSHPEFHKHLPPKNRACSTIEANAMQCKQIFQGLSHAALNFPIRNQTSISDWIISTKRHYIVSIQMSCCLITEASRSQTTLLYVLLHKLQELLVQYCEIRTLINYWHSIFMVSALFKYRQYFPYYWKCSDQFPHILLGY